MSAAHGSGRGGLGEAGGSDASEAVDPLRVSVRTLKELSKGFATSLTSETLACTASSLPSLPD